MAIFSGKSAGQVDLQGSTGNTTLHNLTTRSVITQHRIVNNASVQVQVSVYRSPSSTSAAGKKIDTVVLAPGASKDVLATTGLGLQANEFIVGVVDTLGIGLAEVQSDLTYTEFTADS